MKLLKQWMEKATPREQELLAKFAGTKRNYLQQVAGGHRRMTVELAGKIERASRMLNKKQPRLPILDRAKLTAMCAACPYAKKCQQLKERT